MALRSSCVRTIVILVTLVAPAGLARPAEPEFRIRMGPSPASLSIHRALAGARERLGGAECRKLFTDFADAQGRPLQQRLDQYGFTPEEFLGYVGFYEGEGQGRCRNDSVVAFTQPGSLAVRVCPLVARQDPDTVELIVLHEMLHSLGLQENPPTSQQITQQVRRRCGEERVRVRTARR